MVLVMINTFELFLFAVSGTVAAFIMCFCCAALAVRIRNRIQLSSRYTGRSRHIFNRGRDKADDDPPPIFSITTMSTASSSSRVGDRFNDSEFVDISIEEQPPPNYFDDIVVKPTKMP